MIGLHERPNSQLVFASAEKAWHQLQPTRDELFTANEGLELSGMDAMTFKTEQLVSRHGEVLMPSHKAVLMRDADHPELEPYATGVVGKDRKIFVPRDMARPADLLMDVSGGHCATVGMWQGGVGWFICMRVPEAVQIGGDDHWLYVVLSDSIHGAFVAHPTVIRWECWNTAQMSTYAHVADLKAGRTVEYRLRHSSDARIDLMQMREALALSYRYVQEADKVAYVLKSRRMEPGKWNEFTNAWLGGYPEDAPIAVQTKFTNKASAMTVRLWEDVNRSTFTGGLPSYWSAFQATTRYVELDKRAKGKADDAAYTFAKTMDPAANADKARALEMLVAM